MANVKLYNMKASEVGSLELSDALFNVEYNESVIHQAVVARLANERQGTKSTLTRSEVRGGGAKPWRQKGTGRARQGSTRSPQWIKGGVVFAPKSRDFSIAVPKKVKRLALKGALTSKATDKDIIILDSLEIEAKTKAMVKVLANLKVEGKAYIVNEEPTANVERAAANIPGVKTAQVNTINPYDIINADNAISIFFYLFKGKKYMLYNTRLNLSILYLTYYITYLSIFKQLKRRYYPNTGIDVFINYAIILTIIYAKNK